MARYIDADVLIEKMTLGEYIFAETPFQKGVNANTEFWISEIKYMPTADVVPKSEIEEIVRQWKEEANCWQNNYITEIRANEQIKAEAAREIFEEIDELLVQNATMQIATSTLHCKLAELKKRYTESEGNI